MIQPLPYTPLTAYSLALCNKMTIIPFPVGTYPVRVLQERATPMYQGCYALEQSNVVHIEALDPIDPSDCANVCSTYGSVNLGINAQ